MSISVMNLVWNSKSDKGDLLESSHKRFVLLALADTASDLGRITALRIPTICRKSGLKRSKVYAVLKELEHEDQLIMRTARWQGKLRRASGFWINVPLLREIQCPVQNHDDSEEENPFTLAAAVSAGEPTVHDTDYPVHDTDYPVHDTDTSVPCLVPSLIRSGADGADESARKTTDGGTRGHSRPPSSPRPSGPVMHGIHTKLAAAIAEELNLYAAVGAQGKQLGQIRRALAAALSRGVSEKALREYAATKGSEANTVKYLVNSLSEDYLVPTTLAKTKNKPTWCGTCDENTRQRLNTEGTPFRCAECHPLMTGPENAGERRGAPARASGTATTSATAQGG